MSVSKRKNAKNWIKVKRGMVTDPKHRQKIGGGIWYYLMLVDMADFETGIVDPYKDEDIAADMSASVSWVRKMRRILEDLGYIEARQLGPKGMQIVIGKWVNPRGYDGEVKNVPGESDTNVSPSKKKGDMESDTESITESDTVHSKPSFISGFSDQESVKDSAVRPEKPKTERPRNLVYEALADVFFGIKDIAQINGDGSRIGKLWGWLKKAEPDITPERIQAFGAWYDRQTADSRTGNSISRPKDLAKVQEWWARFKEAAEQPVFDDPYLRKRKV